MMIKPTSQRRMPVMAILAVFALAQCAGSGSGGESSDGSDDSDFSTGAPSAESTIANATVTPASLAFESGALNQKTSKSLVFINGSSAAMTLSITASNSDAFHLRNPDGDEVTRIEALSVAAGETAIIPVYYLRRAVGTAAAKVIINTDSGRMDIPITGSTQDGEEALRIISAASTCTETSANEVISI